MTTTNTKNDTQDKLDTSISCGAGDSNKQIFNDLIIHELSRWHILNDDSVNAVLDGEATFLWGLALEEIKTCLYSVTAGLSSWGERYPEQKKRQEDN